MLPVSPVEVRSTVDTHMIGRTPPKMLSVYQRLPGGRNYWD
jgi:hypothetical protein